MTEEELKVITKAVQVAIDGRMDTITQKQDEILAMVQNHEKTLYHGNGTPALVATVKEHDKFIAGLQKVGTNTIQGLTLLVLIGVIILLVQHGLMSP